MEGTEKDNKNKSERMHYVDIAKAIGIYFVILGHLVIFNYKEFRFIFAFHMPLFFMLSGIILWKKRDQNDSLKQFLKRIIKHYLFPYFLALLLSFLQCYLLPIGSRNLEIMFSADNIKNWYEGYFIFSYFSSSWFLLCMFWAQLFFFLLRKIKRKTNSVVYVLIWITWGAVAIFAKDIFSPIPYFNRMPLLIDTSFMATVFIGIGFLFQKGVDYFFSDRNDIQFIKNIREHLESSFFLRMIVGGLVAVLCGILVYFVSCKGQTYVNMLDLEYAKPFRYLLGGFIGSVMVICLAVALENVAVLRFIGQNTLVILLVHEVIYSVVISLINRFWNLRLNAMGMRFDYICFLISIITMFLSVCISMLVNAIKKKLIKQLESRTSNKYEKN